MYPLRLKMPLSWLHPSITPWHYRCCVTTNCSTAKDSVFCETSRPSLRAPAPHACKKNPFLNQHLTLASRPPRLNSTLISVTYKVHPPAPANPQAQPTSITRSNSSSQCQITANPHLRAVLDDTFRIWLGMGHAGLLPQLQRGLDRFVSLSHRRLL